MNDIVEASEYLLIAALIIMATHFFIVLFQIFVRKNVLRKNEGSRLVWSCLVLAVLALLCAIIIWALQNEAATIWFGMPLFVGSLVTALLLGWAFGQLRGTEQRAMSVLETMVGVIEAGDPNLDGHSLQVRNLAMLLYENLPFHHKIKVNPSNLEYAALLLDVGKLGVPRNIIQKSGKLEKEEWDLIRRHPEIAVQLLQPIKSFDTISTWIKYHHERVDGTGYYHLTGEQIPLASRLIAVADTYSALIMERSYKATLSHEDAVAELRHAAGSQLDEELVKIFCAIPRKKIEASGRDVQQKMQRYQAGNFR